MPDQDSTIEPSGDQQADPDAEQTQGDPADGLGEGGKKALEAERKRASEAEKQAKALQAQLDALNDSKLTETERLQKQIEDLSTRYEQAQLAETRNRVAVAEQIPSQLVGYLAGSDEAELIDSAQTLKAAIAEATKPGTPKPDPSQGAQGKPAGGTNAEQFASFLTSKLSS